MSRQSKRQTGMRARIAAAAARIMAEDGIDDFALAKRKAARQLGAVDTEALPRNDEVEAELRAYRALYQAGEHPELIEELRRLALEVMQALEQFNPYLTGPVLDRKSTRLNSSHQIISYAVFCLKKKKTNPYYIHTVSITGGDLVCLSFY